ncbi:MULTISPECIES: pore-forming ESAT-6 family protein [Streptomyces]|uniref:pore-forming ESAT-6 family protein n=1 Tax=Streptomyces TaxID=1883 RepID=UPI000CD5B91D|nr:MULTISPECIES: pore-forming ESAT-6 family protein [Streptomyces]
MADNRLAYDTSASAETEMTIAQIVSTLELLTGDRNADVKKALADFHADNVSEEYGAVESDWGTTAENVRIIIDELKRVLEENDGIAQQTSQRAAAAVANIR